MSYMVFHKEKDKTISTNTTNIYQFLDIATKPIVIANTNFICEMTPNGNMFDAISLGHYDFERSLRSDMKSRINTKNINLQDVYYQSQQSINVQETFDLKIRRSVTTATVDTNINSHGFNLTAMRKIANKQALQNGMKKFIYDLINPIISFQTFVQNTPKLDEFYDFLIYIKNNDIANIYNKETVQYSSFSNFKTFVNCFDFKFIKNFVNTCQFEKYNDQIRHIKDLLTSIKIKVNINLKGIKFFQDRNAVHIKLGNIDFKSTKGITNEVLIAHLVSQKVLDKFQIQLERLKLLSN
jgi:hypothetical protein